MAEGRWIAPREERWEEGKRGGESVTFLSTGKINLSWKTLLQVFSAIRARVGLNREREQRGEIL